jgi:cyclic pyranopterin phosphate synthase
MASQDIAGDGGPLLDTRGRQLRDLRISVTDRCNFRCVYCMPKTVFGRDHGFLPHQEVLSYEEITRLARLFAAGGVRKIRLTGGEPTLRRDLETLIEMLAQIPGVELTLTTNGSTLPHRAASLRAAGLDRITVSLDAMDDAVFRRMNDVDFPVGRVLEGIAAAKAAGFAPVKINMVVKKGANDGEILPLVRHFRGSGHILRFIEYMDVGTANDWRRDEVVPSGEVIRRIGEHFPVAPIDASYPGEVAERWRFLDGSGEIGVISSVTRSFCSTCTRLRLATDGKLYTCLFALQGTDLRPMLRGGATDADIAAAIAALWRRRADHYSELRQSASPAKKVEMFYVGG